MHRTCWSQSQGAEQTSIECDRCDALRCLQMHHASDVHPVLTKKQCFGRHDVITWEQAKLIKPTPTAPLASAVDLSCCKAALYMLVNLSGSMYPAPMSPKPPAVATAAATPGPEMPAMGAAMTGTLICNKSVSGLCMVSEM